MSDEKVTHDQLRIAVAARIARVLKTFSQGAGKPSQALVGDEDGTIRVVLIDPSRREGEITDPVLPQAAPAAAPQAAAALGHDLAAGSPDGEDPQVVF